MTDAEFWDHVFANQRYGGGSYWDDSDLEQVQIDVPCPECGAYNACAYDDEGRGLIHVTPDGDA